MSKSIMIPMTSVKYTAPNTILIKTDEHGRPLNPRGPVRDTTDLQASIKEVGRILEPLLVERDELGQLWIVSGHRRLTAARILHIDVPYIEIEPTAGDDSLDMMLATGVHQAFPDIVLGKNGVVVGGVAAAVAKKLADGRTRESLARLMGIRPDVVSAYERLMVAPVEVRKAVANGRLSMSAFARMKHAPAEVQSEIVASASANGNRPVTVNAVRDGLRQAKQKRQPQLSAVPEEQTVIARLNGMLADLRGILNQPLSPRERFLINQIHNLTKETRP